jgi:hypothetical protein
MRNMLDLELQVEVALNLQHFVLRVVLSSFLLTMGSSIQRVLSIYITHK